MSAALALQPQPRLLVPDFTPEYTLVLDFETYWAQDYTLRAMTTIDYISDPRFEVIGVAVYDGEESVWFEHHEFVEWAKTVPWHKTAVCAHNTLFDGGVLSYRYGIRPAILMCTMSMARAYGIDGGVGLENLAEHFGVGVKGKEVESAKGKRRRDFTHEEWLRYGEYSKNDAALCQRIFDAMIAQNFPEPELYVISATLKMFTEPKLIINEPLLTQYLFDEQQRKAGLLQRVERDKSLVMSNEKFAAELVALGVDPPLKVSVARTKKARTVDPKAKSVMGFAFAKTDPGMQELLEHEEEEVRWLAEARVAVKSTINETRTQRFLRLGKGGQPVGVGMKWFGAHTGRWSATEKTNFQNLQRTNKKDPSKGALRKALLSPFRKKFVAADSSQIEARIVAWLADDEELLGLFARRADVYSTIASDIYGREVNPKKNPELDEIPRQVGKVCLAGETPVLTEHRGWVRLDEVCQTDRVWDGVEWVHHQGLLDNGVKEALCFAGLTMTPEHEVWVGSGWTTWRSVLESPSLFRSALASGVLPFSVGVVVGDLTGGLRAGSHMSGVCAVQRATSTGPISKLAVRLAAMRAQKRPRVASVIGNTKTHSPMMLLVNDCSIAVLRSSLAATIRRIASFGTMVAEAFSFATSGGLTLSPSFGTLPNFLVGTNQSWNLTVPTTIGGMSLGMFGSLREPSTAKIKDKLGVWKTNSNVSVRRTRVYDILSAGPRKRFTIMSSAGPLVVSNCVLGLGFGQGWFKLAENFLKGSMAAPVQFDFNMAMQMGVDLNKWYQEEDKVERVRTEMVSRLPIEELQIHCACSHHVVQKYRKARQQIVKFWRTMEDVLQAMLEDDADYSFGPNECLRVVRHGIVLPNGLMLKYPGLAYNSEETNSAPEGFSYLAQYGKKRVHTYGGAMTENVTQALARIVISEQMLHMMALGFEPQLITHDDLAYVVPDEQADWLSDTLRETMAVSPSWAAGLPLAVEGGFNQSYGLIDKRPLK